MVRTVCSRKSRLKHAVFTGSRIMTNETAGRTLLEVTNAFNIMLAFSLLEPLLFGRLRSTQACGADKCHLVDRWQSHFRDVVGEVGEEESPDGSY